MSCLVPNKEVVPRIVASLTMAYNSRRDGLYRGRNHSQGGDYNAEYRNFRPRRSDRYENSDEIMEFCVPSYNLGLIIGKQGSRIRELQEQTNTRISIKRDEQNNYGEVPVTIEGSPTNCEEVKSQILRIVSGNASSQHSSNHNGSSMTYYNENVVDRENDHNEKKEKGHCPSYKDYLMQEKARWSAAPGIVKAFYVEDPAVASMTRQEADELRKKNQNIVVESLAGMTEKDERDPDMVEIDPKDDAIPNPVRTFREAFGSYPEIMGEIKRAGFERPSPIQMQAWPIILKGRDLIGIAQTGTGKTLAFLLPAFIHIEGQIVPRKERPGPTVLIITPTRELALQIEEEVNKYKYRNIKCVCIYGGASRRDQIQSISEGVEIVVATPGRLNDLIMNNYLNMESVSYVVLDEADRMLDLGFQPDIYKALYEVRPGRQTIMTTATWPSEVRRLAFKFLRDPFQVFVGSLDLTAVHTVEQRIIIMDALEKYGELKRFLKEELVGDAKAIVFMTKKATVDHVASELSVFEKIFCASITGDRDQCDREAAILDIKKGTSKALLATDIASRGIDIKDITHVINFDFPKNIEEYVHRIGRTGRAGRTGISITYFTREDWRHASELIKIMEEAGQAVPEELYKMAKRFEARSRENDRGRRQRF